MKNNIKKIIVGILGFAMIMSAQSVFASSVTWNTASNDCKSMSIANATTLQGYQNPCWPNTSVSADAGQLITVRIYYHNTGTVTATNAHLMITPNTALGNSSTTKSFTGRITSDQGSISISQYVTANLTSSQSLTLSSVEWYTGNTSETLTSLLDSPSSVLTSAGLPIGDITAEWSSQGSLAVSFRISSNVVPQLCQDTTATNYHGALPCTYPVQVCQDTSANNYGGTLPCTYPAQVCKDTSANNYGGTLPCTYPPQLCQDSSATNYHGALPCAYPSRICTDTTASNYGGLLPCTYPVRICTDTTATNYGGALPCVYPQQVYCTISNFTANPSSITSGDSSVLNWSTSNCTNVVISNLGYNVPTSGLQTVYPTDTKTYVLSASGTNGISVTRSATVYVNNNDNNHCTITSFTASDTSIQDGDSTVLRWNTNECDHVRLSTFSGNLSQSGSKTVYPSDDTTYILTAYSTNGGTDTDSVRIYVDNNNDNNSSCYINSFTSNNIYINSGDPVTLRWNTTGCSNATISNLGYNVPLSGSQIVYPTSTTNYVLNAYGNNSQSRSIQVNVNYNNPIIVPVYNTNVVTTVATNISQTGAQLNGLITSTNYVNNSNVHFEYGKDVTLGSMTTARTTNGNTNFNELVSNLSPNTIYFFQAVSNGTNGVSRGAIEIFKTLGYQTGVITPVKKVVIQGPTVYASASPIMLKIEDKYQAIGVGDTVDYTVYYKNISNSKLKNPMVQVFIPQGVTLINTSIGTYSESDKTLSVPIADLNPSDEGVIYLQGRVDSLDVNLAQIVTTAILVYTNPNGAQENAMAYVLNNPKLTGNSLGAAALFGNIFGMSLIGWLIIIILIMLLILLARSINGRRTVTTTPVHNQ